MTYQLSKVLRNSFDGLWVSQPGIDSLKALLKDGQHVILIPTYKSFSDMFVLLYALIENQIQLPFTIGNLDDTPRLLVDKLLRKIGYILMQRSRNQSFMQSYINHAILRELVLSYPLTMMFQNQERVRSGRCGKSIVSDMSILWLLQAYVTSMQGGNKNVHLVPVTINYERIFEMNNLATEMVSGQNEFNLWKIHKMLKGSNQGRLGKAFIIFGKSISLKEFITNEGLAPVNAMNINDAGLRLTERLLQNQEQQSPVSLNQIVATLLLQDQTTKISLTALHQNCIYVFKYLKGRNCNSFVTIEPTLFAVQRIVERLGFKTQPMLVQTKGRHNELEIMLNPKLD